jgi:hypothetical protein
MGRYPSIHQEIRSAIDQAKLKRKNDYDEASRRRRDFEYAHWFLAFDNVISAFNLNFFLWIEKQGRNLVRS